MNLFVKKQSDNFMLSFFLMEHEVADLMKIGHIIVLPYVIVTDIKAISACYLGVKANCLNLCIVAWCYEFRQRYWKE